MKKNNKIAFFALPGLLAACASVQPPIVPFAVATSPEPEDKIAEDGTVAVLLPANMQADMSACFSGFASASAGEKKEWQDLADFFQPAGNIILAVNAESALFIRKDAAYAYGWNSAVHRAVKMDVGKDTITPLPPSMRVGLTVCFDPNPKAKL